MAGTRRLTAAPRFEARRLTAARRFGAVGALLAVLVGGGCTSKPDVVPPIPSSAVPRPTGFQPGADGAGDPYFPTYGNSGYDVAGYELDLRYEPATDRLTGTATITATATTALSRFNLDLAHLTVSEVTVDGEAARHGRDGNELVVTPRAGLTAGRKFSTRIRYGGTPKTLGNATLGQGGFLHTDGGAIALGQPESASTWFPVNDHPSDKATFTLRMTVPKGVEALSVGSPGKQGTVDGWTTWTWTERAPMASYLATVVIGQYRVTSTTHRGRPVVIAVPASMPASSPAAISVARTTEVADYLETLFGPYPFESYGGVVVEDPRVGYALETQSRPVYASSFFGAGPNLIVVAHELAHQWFGDSVSMRQWRDMWLNEGFASYAEWLWQEHDGGPSVQASFNEEYDGFDWKIPPGDPGAGNIFSRAVYKRGAMTVHALRLAVGDQGFFRILRTWTAEKRYGNGTTAEFITVAERVSGESLRDMFQQWLFGTDRPDVPRR